MHPLPIGASHHTIESTTAIRPSLWKLFLVWFRIGLQSFGGGAATVLLIRREIIERRGWISEEEYIRDWSLSQLPPGIILIAVMILIGQKLRGWRGIVVSLAGALLPSSAGICLFSTGFLLIEHLWPVQAMMKGVVPATAGLLLTSAFQFAWLPLSKAGRSVCLPLHLTECLLIIGGSALAVAWWHLEMIVVVLAAITLSLGRVLSTSEVGRGEASMREVNVWLYFLLLLKASICTFGGMSNLAVLQHDLPAYGWARPSDFSQALVIGQITPGPSGLWVVSLGYLTYGLAGAAAALLAVVIPPLLILPLNAFYSRFQGQRWVDVLLHSLALVSVGLLISSAWAILSATLQDHWSLVICLVGCGLSMSRRLGGLTLLLLAAGAGLVLYGF